MRILILNWYDIKNPSAGGAERYIHEIFSRLASRGAEVTLFCRRFAGSPKEEEVDGIRVVRVSASLRSLTLGALTLVARAWHHYRTHREDYDLVVDCVNKVPFFTPLYVDKPRLALQFHFNGVTFFRELPPGLAHMTALAEQNYFRLYANEPFVTISQSTQAELPLFDINPSLSRIIYPGTPQPSINGIPQAEKPTIVHIGPLKYYKRGDLLLQAMALVEQAYPEVQLIIVGDGPPRRSLEQMAAALGINGKVRFEGRVSEGRKEELIASAWVHALPSQKEGWGIAVMEAGIAGVPTVATDVPGLRDSVMHGKTGYLVEYGNVQALAGAIVELIEDADLRRHMGEQARLYAQGFTWEASAAQMGEFIEEIRNGGRITSDEARRV